MRLPGRLAATALLGLAGVVAAWAAAGPGPPEPLTEAEQAAIERRTDIYSDVFVIDQKYRSMQGPLSEVEGSLLDGEPELLWITGYRAVMVDAQGDEERPQDFMCHANLNIDIDRHRDRFGWKKQASHRLFTLSQGQSEVEFPPGYGIPVASDEQLGVVMQVLNLNLEGEPVEVRHRVTIEYVRDRDLPRPMRPLFMKAASGLVSLGSSRGYFGVEKPDTEQHGEGCLVGEAAAGKVRRDELGHEFTGHWVVPPGRQENHTLVTASMAIPFDTTVHYVAVHLHPYAESLELRDLTTNETVFKSRARNFDDRIGLAEVEHYASVEGFPIHDDHEYELVSVYDNTSGEDQDSMAVMFLYLLDREHERPAGL